MPILPLPLTYKILFTVGESISNSPEFDEPDIWSNAVGVVVPIPTLPLSAVFVILSLPSTTLLLPIPFAAYPITI
jgi:hypothetical protein